MAIPAAVIGSDDVVEKIIKLQAEYPSLQLLAFPYFIEDEVPSLFRQAKKSSDMIIFAGPVPYYIAQSLGKSTIPMLYVSFTGTSLMQVLFQVYNQRNIHVSGLSVDILPKNVIRETLEELGLRDLELYTMGYTGKERSDQLVNFHWRLWQKKKISIALSCLRSAYWELLDKGVPAYRISPATPAIRETLKQAIIQGEQLRSEETQIAVQICDIDGFGALTRKLNSEYEGQRVKLNLLQILNNYAERTRASVHETGGDRFVIFTTRGILERITNYYQSEPLLDAVRQQLPATVSIGTGLGQTTYDAERNALNALKRAKEAGGDCSFAMMADGKVLGPLGKFTRLESYVTSNDPDIINIADISGMSVDAITKIISLLDLQAKDTLTSSELAEALRITSRSATRILNRLVNADLATPAGTVRLMPAGRPRRVYRMKFKQYKRSP